MTERKTNPTGANENFSTRRDSHQPTQELGQESSVETTTDGYAVVFSVGWVVRGVETGQDAINIAVSEVGKLVSSTGERTRSVDISVQRIECNSCGTGAEALLLVSETALVGLFLEVEVNAEDPDTAERIARREVGPHLHNIPLTSVEIAPAD